ncbi:MAG TPA: toxin-antitoxin system YwqK family antitoxin [Pirellulales bacterium]
MTFSLRNRSVSTRLLPLAVMAISALLASAASNRGHAAETKSADSKADSPSDKKIVEEKAADGSVKVRREVSENVSGKLVPDGLETTFYPGGIKRTETTYRLGTKEGPWRIYGSRGELMEEGSYHRGLKDGAEKTYDSEGRVATETNYRDGIRNGKKITWNGQRKLFEAEYENGVPIGTLSEWYGDGTPKIVQHYRGGVQDGLEQRWYSGGKKFYEANYVAGKKDGQYTEWHPNGKPKYATVYKAGQPDGVFKEWFEDGALKTEGGYLAGLSDGPWKEWNKLNVSPFDVKSDKDEESKEPPKHSLAMELNYRKGQLDGKQVYYYRNGAKQLEVLLDNGKREGPYTEWYDNGQVRSIGKYLHDDLNGETHYWYDTGKPWAVYNYYRGKPVGRWIEWDKDGKLVRDENHL